MASMSQVPMPPFALSVAGVLLLSASLASACRSGLKTSQQGDASTPPAADASLLGGLTGTGGRAGLGSSGTGGAPPRSDGGSCRSMEIPEFDCPYGTPAYVCIATDGGWAWSFTCPDPPRDAGAPPWDTRGGDELGGGGAGGSGGTTTGGRATGGNGGGTSGTRDDCKAIAERIAGQTQVLGTCTAVVRLDYSTLEIISHAFVCGKYDLTDEAAARNTASADAVFPYASPAGDGKLLSGSSPRDEWVFFQEPSDFGGVAAVSARSGLTVFAGSIVWMGTGKIMVPAVWDTSDLGPGCGQQEGVSVRGFSLAQGEATERMREAADVVLATALPSAFTRWGSPFDAMVLLYPRSVGAFNPTTAEYIVLLNAGWLE